MAPPPLAFQSFGTRTAIVLSFWSAILLAVPFWLKTTTITRLPLPVEAVAQLERERSCPVHFQASLNVQVAGGLLGSLDNVPNSTPATQEIQQLLLDSLDLKTRRVGSHSLACTDWQVTVKQAPVDTFRKTGDYDFVVIPESPANHVSDQGFVITLPTLEDDARATPDSISTAVVERLLQLTGQDALSTATTPPRASGQEAADANTVEQDPRVIQYTRNVRLVFSLMNEDASQGDVWSSSTLQRLSGKSEDGLADIPEALQPIMDLADELRGLHDFHIESQMQWFAPLHFEPTMDEVEVTKETMVEEAYEEEIDEEIEVEVEVEEDDNYEEQASSAASASRVDERDETEVEALVKMADGAECEEDEVDAILGGKAKCPPSSPTPPTPPQDQRRRTPPKKRKETVTRRIARTRLVPHTTVHKHVRHLVEWDDLKVFVNSAEWSLSSTVAPQHRPSLTGGSANATDVAGQTHDLHFIIYVPSASHRPMQIRDPETGGASDSTAWLIPQWGGVVLLNPSESPSPSPTTASNVVRGERGVPAVKQIPTEQLLQAMELFAQQLEILVGFSRRDGDRSYTAEREMRLDALLSKRTLENARETVETLGGIVRLVDKIENLGVGQEIRQDVDNAIAILASLNTHLSNSSPYDRRAYLIEALDLSCRASTLASRAFFSPTMLGLLYFPDEHKYAVYTPLFGPLLVPLLVALAKCLKEWIGRIKEGRKKARKGRGKGQTRAAGKSLRS